MGASGWTVRVAWRGSAARALSEARARAYRAVPAATRRAVASAPPEALLQALDLDPDDEEGLAAWLAWLKKAPPESRHAASQGPNGTGSVLDVDHVVPRAARPAARPPLAAGGAPVLMLLQPAAPGLLGARWATSDELRGWFGGLRPQRIPRDFFPDELPRDTAVLVARWRDDVRCELVIYGVTGD